MIINGREIKFKRTVMATCIIADRCPEGDIQRAAELFNGDYRSRMENGAIFAVALNDGYERNRAFEEPGYKPHPLTVDEVMLLDFEDYEKLIEEATTAFAAEMPTIETMPSKKNTASK